MTARIELRPLALADAEAHTAGEDSETVRWLTGEPGSVEATRRHIVELRANAAAEVGKRGFGIWWQGRLAGYIDFDPGVTDGLEPGDVNLSYAVHAWARGRGVAPAAVGQVCEALVTDGAWRRAALRIVPDNARSVRVAEKCGFEHVRDFVSTTDTDASGQPCVLGVWVRAL